MCKNTARSKPPFLRTVSHDALPPPTARDPQPKVMLMPDPMAGLPPRLLRTPDARGFLGISNRTLEKHGTYGTGQFIEGGRSCRLCCRGLASMVRDGARKSTTDQTAHAVFPGPPD